jgi:hypothetical protein
MKSVLYFSLTLFFLGLVSSCGDSTPSGDGAAPKGNVKPESDAVAAKPKEFRSAAMPAALDGLTELTPGKLAGGISWVNGKKADFSAVIPIPKGPARIQGWAIDPVAQQLCSKVYVMVDGVPHSTRYGLERKDVADSFKKPKYAKSGVLANISRQGFGSGSAHQLQLVAISKDGKSYFKVGAPVQISF